MYLVSSDGGFCLGYKSCNHFHKSLLYGGNSCSNIDIRSNSGKIVSFLLQISRILPQMLVKDRNILFDVVFQNGPSFCTQFDPLNDFSIRRSLYQLKPQKCKNLRSFDFFELLKKNIFNLTLNITFLLVLVGDV